MPQFRTTFEVAKSNHKINYKSNIISLGSCFSENIGEKLTYYKFSAIINPFGILYNPESVAQSIDLLINGKLFAESDLFEYQGIWNSFYHHSKFSDTNKKIVLNQINSSLKQASTQLKKADFLLVTFGTSWVFELKNTNKIISNCHKIPSNNFNRNKLSIDEIVIRYKNIIQTLQKINPKLKIVFTVSPIRHLKDGAVQNQISKATLIMAIHKLVNEFENTSYFPSYEIMIDDLRDYRFYNEDMVHPSPTAVKYIWDKFCDSYIPDEYKKLIKDIDKINQAMQHRPFHPDSDSYKKFLSSTLLKIEKIEKQHNVDFLKEKIEINRLLT